MKSGVMKMRVSARSIMFLLLSLNMITGAGAKQLRGWKMSRKEEGVVQFVFICVLKGLWNMPKLTVLRQSAPF